MKRSPVNKAKARANYWFSKFIRTRDAIETTGTLDEVLCVTCGKQIPVGKADCGHFIPGRTTGVLYREDNANAMCVLCNRFRQGAWPAHEKALISKYGRDNVERLKSLYGFNPPIEEAEYRDIARCYREKYKDLLKRFENGSQGFEG